MQIDNSFGVATKRAREDHPAGTLTLDFDTFAWSALAAESAALGVSIDELAHFSVLYYVSDRDSGRIARALPAAARRKGPAGWDADASEWRPPVGPSAERPSPAERLAASLSVR